MFSVANEQRLFLLEFCDGKGVDRELERFGEGVVVGSTEPIRSIVKEMEQYFAGSLREFKTPILPAGTPFQQRVWSELRKIPHAESRSYLEIAKAIGQPSTVRAVAQANAANLLAIIIPCHRVINSSGKLGGYKGGVQRKEWLLSHE